MTRFMIVDLAVYKAYLIEKAKPDGNVSSLVGRFNISRTLLYKIINYVEKGNPAEIREELVRCRLDVLWNYKYKNRFLTIPKGRTQDVVDRFKSLVKDMKKDGFGQVLIAKLTKKTRNTIIHHLKSK